MTKNFDEPIEIAQDIFWVGHIIENDPFQCHVYLIKNADNSILIDPGSNITWPTTRKKIQKLIDLTDIRYFICHHQDPDITACMSDIFKEIGTKDRYVITHWRTKALLVHYNWGVEFIEVESNNFHLNLGSRELDFIFTPYMHFPGNICTYDIKTKTLFSSDIFGAFTDEFQLFAQNAQDYFEQAKPFLEHYMPSNEILRHGIDKIRQYDLDLIAPQHGSIIKKEFIPYILDKTQELNVGLFLHLGGYEKIQKLSKANQIISELSTLLLYETNILKDMSTIYLSIEKILPIKRILALGIKTNALLFDSLVYMPIKLDVENDLVLKLYSDAIASKSCITQSIDNIFGYELGYKAKAYIYAARDAARRLIGFLFFIIDENIELQEIDFTILDNIKTLLEAVLNKAIDYYNIEAEKIRLFEKSIKDELTSLYNRYYFNQAASQEFLKATRYSYPLSVAFLDIDNFKQINDSYGHHIGDLVLKDFADAILSQIRNSDMAFRYGGEEFIILFSHTSLEDALIVVQRIKEFLSKKDGLSVLDKKVRYTFSAGIACLEQGEDIYELVEKADKKMYEAKQKGKDRIEC